MIAADLIKFKDSRAVEPLIQALQRSASTTEDIGIQGLAARILGELGDNRAVEPLIRALQDEYGMTRYWAAVSLARILPTHNSRRESLFPEKNVEFKEVQIPENSFTQVDKKKEDRFMELIEQTSFEIKRIGWNLETCRNVLMEVTWGEQQGKRSRFQCTSEELERFLTYLQNQPTLVMSHTKDLATSQDARDDVIFPPSNL